MPTVTESDQATVEYMKGIQKMLNTFEPDKNKIQQLYTYLDELDYRRNSNWKSVFPYLNIDINLL